MKKIYKILLSLIFIVSGTLMFFGCKKEMKVLSTPMSVAIVNNGTFDDTLLPKDDPDAKKEYLTDDYILITDKNDNATKYRFYITDNNDFENINNYVTIDSDKNYVNINSYFDSQKVYHFFVQYIGDSNFKNSDFSSIKSYTPESEQVDIPYLQIIDTNLYWYRIMNAYSYEIYETIVDGNNEVVQEQTKIKVVDDDVFEFDISNRTNTHMAPYYKYQYSVKALAKGYYADSNMSNSVEYVKSIKLKTPTNLNLTENAGLYMLTWNSVPYATKYKVVINEKIEREVEENSFDVTSYLTEYATYSFKVKASLSEALDYDESDYSIIKEYDYKMTLSNPESIEVSRNGGTLTITFSEVANAQSYTLSIYYNGQVKYKVEELVVTSATVEISTLVGTLNSNKEITIKVSANKVNEYVLGSAQTTLNYTITKETIVE